MAIVSNGLRESEESILSKSLKLSARRAPLFFGNSGDLLSDFEDNNGLFVADVFLGGLVLVEGAVASVIES